MKTVSPFLTLLAFALFASCRTAPTADSASEPQHEPAPLQLIQPNSCAGRRRPHRSLYGIPQAPAPDFCRPGKQFGGDCQYLPGQVVHSIKGLDEPQGVLYVPEFDKIFVANAGSGKVNVYDGKTYALHKSIELGAESDTDNVRWDEVSKRVFVGIVGGIAMIDATMETHVDMDLKGSGGHSESFQLEKKGSRVFVNVPDDNSVVNVIDRRTGGLTKWELKGAKANYPMALDEDDHRLFVVTRRPPLLLVLDTDTGKEVARVPVGGSCDDVYFDSDRKRIYALAGEGFVSVVQQGDPNHYTLRGNIPTAVGVRTGIFFGTSLYVGVPAVGLEPAQVWNYGVPE